MVDFIFKLEELLRKKWMPNEKMTIPAIADLTGIQVPFVLDSFSKALGKEFEVQADFTHDDAVKTLTILKDRLRPQLIAREREIERRRDQAAAVYDRTMERVRILQMDKNWYGAFKSLCYFAGRYENDLAPELALSVASDCIRLGIKANVNFQEIGYWLRKGILCASKLPSGEAMDEALDLIDAYREFFIQENGLKGKVLLKNIVTQLNETCGTVTISPEYVNLMAELEGVA